MAVSRQTGTSNSTQAEWARLPTVDYREGYLFDQRVAAMERRIKDSGLPNQSFPFIAAKCVATPEWNVLKEAPNSYDAVCVLKGLRPVALLSVMDLKREPSFKDYLLRSIARMGLVVHEDPQFSDYVVGEPARVAAVIGILQKRMATGDYSERYHRELGEALAYPPVAIERFIRSIKRGENALEAMMIEDAFPAADESSVTVQLPSGRTVWVR